MSSHDMWNLTKAQWLKRASWSLVITPTIMLFPLTVGPFIDPSILLEHADLYLAFFGAPYAAALALWLYARRLPVTETPE